MEGELGRYGKIRPDPDLGCQRLSREIQTRITNSQVHMNWPRICRLKQPSGLGVYSSNCPLTNSTRLASILAAKTESFICDLQLSPCPNLPHMVILDSKNDTSIYIVAQAISSGIPLLPFIPSHSPSPMSATSQGPLTFLTSPDSIGHSPAPGHHHHLLPRLLQQPFNRSLTSSLPTNHIPVDSGGFSNMHFCLAVFSLLHPDASAWLSHCLGEIPLIPSLV